MADDGPPSASDECNIKVVCRVRPLNEVEERAGSKFILKFPTDDSISVGVGMRRLQQLSFPVASFTFRSR